MSNYDPRSLIDKLLGASVGLLIGALVLSAAVHLLESVWVALLIITLTIVLIIGLIMLLRNRYRGW